MKATSVKLKNYEIEERNPILQSKLMELNRWIIKDLRTWEIDHESDYEVKFHGIMVPLFEGDDRDPSIIVNLKAEMGKSFNTKQRCPIMVVFETISLSEAKSRKNELTEITEISYNQFQEEYSAQKFPQKAANMFEIKKMEELEGDHSPGDDFIFVDQDDWINHKEEQKNNRETSLENAEDDTHLKSFEQFAKFVKMEEHMFTDVSEDIVYSDWESVKSAIYGYEYGHGIFQRRREIVSKEEEAKFAKRPRSQLDLIPRSKNNQIPQNIKKLKDAINKNRNGDNSRKHADSTPKTFLDIQKRQSLLMTEHSNEEDVKTQGKEVFERAATFQAEDSIDYLSEMEGLSDPFGKDWTQLQTELNAKSNYAKFKTYRLRNFIFKSNDDLRQELLAVQLIKRLKKIFDEANLSLYLRPYEIIITSHSSGYLEWVPNAISIDSIKKTLLNEQKTWTFAEFFERRFIYTYEEWQKNFVESLAGYSFLCYLFNIKDRHNGNILLDNRGHLVHIDFGFMFSNSPGGVGFESAPFKLTQDYIDIMGGPDSTMFEYFKSLLNKAFYEVRKHLDDIISMIEIMFKDTQFPCFKGGPTIFDEIRNRCSARFNTGDNMSNEYQELVDRIIYNSYDNWRTRQYDAFQKWTNNIEK